MSADGRIWDGHTRIFGQDGDTEPSELSPSVAAKLINRVCRGGVNSTRPSFRHKEWDFSQVPEYEELIKKGNFQGWIPYRKRNIGRNDGAVVSIAGVIFFLSFVNDRVIPRFIFEGNDPKLMHTWMVQVEEWVYIQNGKDMPIFWNGLIPSQARRSSGGNEMPVGTIMAYCYGRIFLSNAFNQIIASDIIYGNGLTRTDNVQNFTEATYWAEGGYFGQPSDLGDITGMIVMPRQDKSITGQGELVIMSTNGASAIDASRSRVKWKDEQIQAVTLQGIGGESPYSLIAVNNDIWFRSREGVSSYSFAKQDTSQRFSFGKLSRHVNPWLDQDTQWLRQFNSSVYHDNRFLVTVSPLMQVPERESYGHHRFHRGILSLDLDQAGGVQGDSSFNWDGLWTGIRPCALTKIVNKAYIWSFDDDGNNRVYMIDSVNKKDEIEGIESDIEWIEITKKFDWSGTSKSNQFETKKLVGGVVWISDARSRISIQGYYRPDSSLCWSPVIPEKEFGSDFGEDWSFSQARYGRFKFQTPEVKCGGLYPSNHGSLFQFMLKGSGYFNIDRLRAFISIGNDPDLPSIDCSVDDPKTILDCLMENDYEYSLTKVLA